MSQDTKSEGRILMKYAMNYGLILGFFWFVKYIFLISSAFFIHFIYLFNLLSIGTLLLYYVLLNRYRDKGLGGYISYSQCITFSIFLFLFAGIIESSIIYVHIAIIDTGFVANEGRTLMELTEEMFKYWGLATTSIKALKDQPVPSNAFYVMNSIFVNTLIGCCLSLIYGIFARRKRID